MLLFFTEPVQQICQIIKQMTHIWYSSNRKLLAF